jgi:hypothetical protein
MQVETLLETACSTRPAPISHTYNLEEYCQLQAHYFQVPAFLA